MLSYFQMHTVLERKNQENKNIPVDIEFIKSSDGSIILASQVYLINFDKLNGNYRFRWPNGQIRDIKKTSIIKINNHEIFIG